MGKFITVFLIIFGFVALLFSVFHQRAHPVERKIRKLSNQFSSCLPDTLSGAQRKEVGKILGRFNRALGNGRVIRRDRDDVFKILSHYVDKGSISMKELSIFMAKVSYYTFRQNPQNRNEEGRIKPPDHPLLTPADKSRKTSVSE